MALPAAGTVAHYTGVPAAGTRYYRDPVPVTGTGDRTIFFASGEAVQPLAAGNLYIFRVYNAGCQEGSAAPQTPRYDLSGTPNAKEGFGWGKIETN